MTDILKVKRKYQGYGKIRKWASIFISSVLGSRLAYGLMGAFPYIASVPNTILWMMWNRFRNPARYQEFADGRKWVFIMGCTNTGTTLLHHCLASHPDIASMPLEGQFLSGTLTHPSFNGYPRVWTEQLDEFRMTETDLRHDSSRLIHDWKNYLNNINASLMLEKTPFNSVRSRWLQSVFKNSYFIGMVRDGRAVAEGISRRSGGKDINLQRSASHWINNNNVMLEDAKHLKNCYLLKYEDLVENPHEIVTDLCSFFGADPKKYKFDLKSKLVIENIDNENTSITNFNQKSFDRIPKEIFDQLTDQITPLMQRLGYKEF